MKRRWLVQLAVLLSLSSCAKPYWDRRTGPRFTDIDPAAKVIKLHMPNGEVFILSSWRLDEAARAISGEGEQLTPARDLLQRRSFQIPLASVAMFESNRRKELNSTAVSTTVTVAVLVGALLAAIAIPFALNPDTH